MRRRAIPLVLTALSLLVAVVQRPGEQIADTKVHLYLEPWRFLQDVLSAWSPTSDLGHVWAGQYGGYLFPMAPFFALGKAVGLPMWLVERLWLGVILALAAWGVVRLLDALVPGERGAAHAVAGALFVVNPYVAVYADRTSIALLAYAALPWLLLAVHRGLQEPRRWTWPALFALVLTSTGGGVNVAVTGWVLLGPLALVVYDRLYGGVGRGAVWPLAWRLGVATLAANLWWLVPVVVHSRYGLDFLPFTEQPGTIWGTTSVSESLRLMGFWTSYIGVGFGGRLYPFAGHGDALLFNKGVVIAGLLVPGLALASFLSSRRLRHGPFLLALTLLGVLVMAAGWPDGTPLRRGLTFTYNHVEALQFLRTTYKAGPLTALGLAGLAGVGFAALWTRLRGPVPRGAAGAAAIVLAGVAAWPLTTGRAIERQLAFDVPQAWRDVAADLDARGDSSRALLEPGQLFAFSTWGGTIDNVLPALTSHPVATRYIVPFADLRSVDLQWMVDDLVGQGRALPGQLRPLLDLMGVGDVVIAADQDRERGGGPGAVEVTDALASLPGRRTSYGAKVTVQPAAGRVARPRALPTAQRIRTRTGGLVRVLARSPLTVLDGGAQGLGELAAFGALHPDRPIAYAADLSAREIRDAARAGATVVMTDSNRRQAFVASRLRNNRGFVLAADEHVSQDGTMLDPFGGDPDEETVALLGSDPPGLRAATTPFSPQVTQFPEHRPFAALDGDTTTAWLADPALAPDRRRLDLAFDAPRDVAYVDLMPYSDPRGTVRQVTIAGHVYDVRPGWNRLRVALHGVRALQILMSKVDHPRSGSYGAGGIRELRIPGVQAHEALRGPVRAAGALRGADVRAATLVYQLSRVTADEPATVGRLADAAQKRLVRDARDPEAQLARVLDPPAARTWTVQGWTSVAPATADDALDRLVGASGRGAAWSSSRFENRPGARASSAFDGVAATAWLGQWIPGRSAWLAWTTTRETTLRTLRLVPVAGHVRRASAVRVLAAASRAALADAGTAPVLPVAADGTVRLPRALHGRAFRVEIVRARFPSGTTARERQRRAVGVAELRGAGLRLTVPRAGTLHAPCGTAAIVAGARTVQLRVTGSVRDLDAGRALRARGCSSLGLSAQEVEVRGLGRALTVDHLRLESVGRPAPAAPAPAGSVLDQGNGGDGSRSGVRVEVDRPAWLILGESFDRGWRASCDGHDLGAPRPMQGYANAWPVEPGCTKVSFSFAPDRVLVVGYVVSGIAIVLLLGLLLVGRRRRRTEVVRTASPPQGTAAPSAREAPPASPMRLTRAVACTVIGVLAIAFVFALRAGAVAAIPLFAILWRGVGARPLTIAAGALLVVGVPIAQLLTRWDDRGGFNTYYAVDHRAAHWTAVAAVCLLALALIRTLSTARGRDAHGPPSAP